MRKMKQKNYNNGKKSNFFIKRVAFYKNLCYNNQAVERQRKSNIVGVDRIEGTPVPIPNTEVKLNYAEDTWVVTPRENRKMPTRLVVVQ